ncbi:NB-ARC domain-containing protein [Dactylosporangium siamense]
MHGAGGFGKTSVARMVRVDRRVLRRFDGRVYWVTLGRDLRHGALVEKVNDLIRRVDADRAEPFTDVRQAAEHLAAVLAEGPRRLIVLDDVWFDDQLAAFPVAGRCARLVTTRKPSLVAGQSFGVRVDQMSQEQARRVLTADLPGLSPAAVEALLVETGRWPLLLRLTNRNLLAQTQSHTDLAVLADDLLQRLRRDGPLRAAGHLPDVGDIQQLDVSDPDQRSKAVSATIEASVGLLTTEDRARLTELAIFVEDETIPVNLVAALWRATGGHDGAQTRMLCARLTDLALLTLTPTGDGGTIGLHDVIRDYLHEQLGARERQVHAMLLDAVAADLGGDPADSGGGSVAVVAWWQLPVQARYMREHLIEHMLSAGRRVEAEALATDLRWVQSRLQETGPAGPFADLGQLAGPRAARLSRLLGQSAHLLAPTEPPHSLPDILCSLVAHDPDWGPQAQALAQSRNTAALCNTWPLPDLPDSASRRVLTGHTASVYVVAIAPDGTWLATGGRDETLRLWDTATGAERARLADHPRPVPVSAVAMAADGTWLAIASDDGTVQLWDVATDTERARLVDNIDPVYGMVIAPDGTWLATGGRDGKVRLWDTATGAERAELAGYIDPVYAVAIAPDGTWLAAGGRDIVVRLWDVATGAERGRLAGHTRSVRAVAIAPDGTWLATGALDGTVRLWDVATGTERARLAALAGPVHAVAIAPDGTWLATTSDDGVVRLWDAATGAERTGLAGHTASVYAVAIAPDGTWLATGGRDETVRLWDAATGTERARLADRARRVPVSGMAMAVDGAWLATAGDDGTVRLWDVATGTERARLTGLAGSVYAMAIAPDGTWLATTSFDETRLWDVATGTERARLTALAGAVRAVAIAPDGSWLATASDDGMVRLWDVATGAERVRLAGVAGSVYAVAVAPDGSWLATASFSETRLWDVATGAERVRLAGHTGSVSAVAIAPDGSWLATAGDDGVVRLWDAATGAERARLDHARMVPVSGVAITADGTWLATVSNDHTVRIWHAGRGDLVAVMRTHERISGCIWSPHDYNLLAGGPAGLYRFAFTPRRSGS